MFSANIAYHIISIIVIAFISYSGFSLPIHISQNERQGPRLVRTRSQCSEHQNTNCKQLHDYSFNGKDTSFLSSPLYTILKTFSAGIILGVAVLHLLDDSFDKLKKVTSLPVGEFYTCAGIAFTLMLEQIALAATANPSEDNIDGDHPEMPLSENSSLIRLASKRQIESGNSAYHSFEIESSSAVKAAGLKTSHALARTIVLETSVFVHSMVIGFGLGSTQDIMIIRLMIVALSFHQFFEGISLGSMILESGLSDNIQQLFAAIFALSLPFGVVLGLGASARTVNSAGNDYLQGCANAVAAGSLLYTCLVEIVHEEFRHCWLLDDNDEGDCRIEKYTPTERFVHANLVTFMVMSLSFGVVVMAILAIFA